MRARGVVHAGVCVDPREGVECPDNAGCADGVCACDAGYKPILDRGDDPFEPELARVDACAGVLCTGDNAHCSNGACKCDEGHHDPDGDGDCTKVCGPDEVDDVAKASLKAIPKEPWERGESYSCKNNAVVVNDSKPSTKSLYLYDDYPKNSEPNEDKGDVCTLNLSGPKSSLAYGHSHPHFKYPRDKGVICLDEDEPLTTRKRMSDQNRANARFNSNDKNAAESINKPLYLVVPERNKVKVYRKNNGRWRVENL